MVDTEMAEKIENAEEVEVQDPWDFDDPEIEDVTQVEEDIPEVSEEDTEDSSDGISDEIVERARTAGLTKDELVTMGSPDTVNFVLDLLEQKVQQIQEEARNTVPDEDDAAQVDKTTEPGSDEFNWIDELDPDEAVDSDSIRALKAMKLRLDEMSGTMKSMSEQNRTTKTESFFMQLDAQWSELFGDAKEQSATNKTNRQTVVDEMDALRDGYRSRKKRIPEEPELFERALRSAFGEHEKNFARDEISEKIKQRESQFLSRTQSRPTQELLTGREKAVSSVAARMRELGLSELDDIGETFE